MRVLIADDHGIFREGLRSLIEKLPDTEVVGQAQDGQMAVELAKKLNPNIIVMDVTMPLLNGIEAMRQIISHNPNIKVIALSMHPDKHIVKGALEAGASAYILKSNLFDELARAIDAVLANQRYLSPRIADVVIEDYVRPAKNQKTTSTEKLTPRERQIVQLLAEGLTIKQIAMQLKISPKTADASRRKIMNKLDLSSTADLVKYAIREGLTSLEF
ncbi:MAG: response regulator [Planctomycetota bacterium]|jgi:DNA-binding NarL/FixJ family response regulator